MLLRQLSILKTATQGLVAAALRPHEPAGALTAGRHLLESSCNLARSRSSLAIPTTEFLEPPEDDEFSPPELDMEELREPSADGAEGPSVSEALAELAALSPREFAALPRKKRLEQIQSLGKYRPPPNFNKELIDQYKQSFDFKVVDINSTQKVTKGGRIQTYCAFVICGNGDGVAGFGKGKSAEVPMAVEKAMARSLKNLHFFERYKGHTVMRDFVTKYKQTKLYLWQAKYGKGITAGSTIENILKFSGFRDVKAKVVGSRHPHNTVKAAFKALSLLNTEAPGIRA